MSRHRRVTKAMQNGIPVRIPGGGRITLCPGEHNELTRAIIEDFGARFLHDGQLISVRGTRGKSGRFNSQALARLGVEVAARRKMPDVVFYDRRRNWLLLVESVTSHGAVDVNRHAELARLFAQSTAKIVYISAFPNREVMGRYPRQIAWETNAWIANEPSHLIHFDGGTLLGPYSQPHEEQAN